MRSSMWTKKTIRSIVMNVFLPCDLHRANGVETRGWHGLTEEDRSMMHNVRSLCDVESDYRFETFGLKWVKDLNRILFQNVRLPCMTIDEMVQSILMIQHETTTWIWVCWEIFVFYVMLIGWPSWNASIEMSDTNEQKYDEWCSFVLWSWMQSQSRNFKFEVQKIDGEKSRYKCLPAIYYRMWW